MVARARRGHRRRRRSGEQRRRRVRVQPGASRQGAYRVDGELLEERFRLGVTDRCPDAVRHQQRLELDGPRVGVGDERRLADREERLRDVEQRGERLGQLHEPGSVHGEQVNRTTLVTLTVNTVGGSSSFGGTKSVVVSRP